jgi:threonine aldolase
VSLLASTRRGDSILLADNAHIFLNEAGNLAAIAGLLPTVVSHARGLHRPEQIESAVRPQSVLYAPLSLICIENTLNAGGGRPLGVKETEAISAAAHGHGLKVHLDGARIFNAAVAEGVSAAALARGADSVTFCFSKGLGCPQGSIVAGSAEFVAAVRHWRQVIGGGMRQAGVAAAAGLLALDTMIERLTEDHANARRLAELLQSDGFELAFEVMTNMVFVETPRGVHPDDLVRLMKEQGVIVNPAKGRRLRFVTHADLSASDIDEAFHRVHAAFVAAKRVRPPEKVT